jgi:DNA polymerase-3 subunit delta'
MQFSEIVGQEGLKDKLRALVRENRTGHAILLSEEPGYGALPMAVAFANYLACKNRTEEDSCGTCSVCNKFSKLIYPDLHFAMPVNTSKEFDSDRKPVSDSFLVPWREIFIRDPYFSEQDWYRKIDLENKSGIINVAEASLVTKKLSMRAFEGGLRFLIMWLPEKMNSEASNRLLKIIEEPSPGIHIILVSDSPGRVMPTILSRCQIFALPPIDKEPLAAELSAEYDMECAESEYWAKISGGSLSKARYMIANSAGSSRWDDYLVMLLEGCASRSLSKVISFWEKVSLLSREEQKVFLEHLLEFVRRSLMMSLGQEAVANVPPSRREFVSFWAARIKPTFYEKAYDIVIKAKDDINRNVNSKYIFADIGNRFFLYL